MNSLKVSELSAVSKIEDSDLFLISRKDGDVYKSHSISSYTITDKFPTTDRISSDYYSKNDISVVLQNEQQTLSSIVRESISNNVSVISEFTTGLEIAQIYINGKKYSLYIKN